MSYTKEQLDEKMRESVQKEEALIREYRRTHDIPGRGMILTPEIKALRDEQKALYAEYCKLHKQP